MHDDECPPIRAIAPSPGGQLRVEDVVGREREIARAWELLDRASIRLNEPRRIGKTSALTKMSAEPAEGWICIHQSFQGVNSVAEMAARALDGIARHQSLTKRARDRAKQFLSSTKPSVAWEGVKVELAWQFRDDPMAALEAALGDVHRVLGEKRLLLAWDEVPDMVLDITRCESPDAAVRLLAMLRRFRDEGNLSSIRWLMTGSVGFHHALRGLDGGDGLVNDLDNLGLGPLRDPWTRWLAASLLLGAKVAADDAAVDALVAICGGIPFLMHLVAKQAQDRSLRVVTADTVPVLFDEALGDLDQSQQATHFLSRLDRYYGNWTPDAEWILDRIAQRPATLAELGTLAKQRHYRLPDDDTVRDLLTWLLLDHYLAQRPGVPAQYEWRYPPLARVWRLRRLSS